MNLKRLGFLFVGLSLSAPLLAEAGSLTARSTDPDFYEKIYDETILNKSAGEYVQEINSGWGPGLKSLRKSLNPSKNYIVLHVIEPGIVYDLRSAEHFRRGLLAMGIEELLSDDLALGHVFTSWRCQVNGQAVEGTTGITGELDKQFTKMLNKGWGMTAFYSHFQDGHLQTPKLLEHEWKYANTLHTVAVEVDDQVCQNAMKFVSDFIHHPDQPYTNFGPNLNPTNFEGGGCGSFGVSVLQKSGIFGRQNFWPVLWRKLRAPRKTFAYGLKSIPEDAVVYKLPWETERERDAKTTVRFFLRSWKDEDGDGPALNQQDPEMLLLFLKTLYRLNPKALSPNFTEREEYKYRVVKKLGKNPTIDKHFDPKAAAVVSLTRDWLKDLAAAGYKARPSSTGSADKTFPALVLDRE